MTSKVSHPLKFAANLSMMWAEEASLSKRYNLAKAAGFDAVEMSFPYMEAADVLKQAKEAAGISHVLINTFPGDMKKGEAGFAAIPEKKNDFMESFDLTLTYARALNCDRIHIMSGKKYEDCNLDKMEATLVENLKYASDILSPLGITGLIEPLNTIYTAPNYFLDSYETAVRVIEKVQRPNIKLQLDIYHLQVLHGNLTHNIKKYLPIAGHIQVAQPPRRSELGSEGEIDYSSVLRLLQTLKWSGFVALEYVPSGNTEESLSWLNQWRKENQ